jgi:hypothetical protein
LTAKSDKFTQANNKLKKTKAEVQQITTWLQARFYWGDFMADMRSALIRSEDSVKKKLSAQKPGVEAGIWVDQMISAPGLAASGTPMPGMDMGRVPMNVPGVPPGQASVATNGVIVFVCRAIDLKNVDAAADTDIAYAVEKEIKNSPLVDPKATALSGSIIPDDSNGTFTFTVNVTPVNSPNF